MLAIVRTEAMPRENAAIAMSILDNYNISHSHRYEFQNTAQLKNFLERSYRAFEKGTSPQFVGVGSIGVDSIQWIDKNRRELPPMRLLYDEIQKCLVIKFASKPHNVAFAEFRAMFEDAYRAKGVSRYDIVCMGPSRYRGSNGRHKEADESFKPVTRSLDDKPSFVIEVGLSESLNQLRSDAFHWLTKTNGQKN